MSLAGELIVPEEKDLDLDEGARGRGWLRSRKVVIGASLIGVFVFIAVFGPMLAPYNPSATGPASLAGPSTAHLLGTTNTGQDVLSQLLVGTRETLLVGFVAAAIGMGLAILIGVTAGFVGGMVDTVLSALINIFLVIPVLPLEIVLAGYLANRGWLGITLIISVTAWPFGARMLRVQTLSLRKRDYVEAARVAGERTWRIVGFEILPNLTAIIVTGFLFHVMFAIVVQTGLAFLGIGNPSAWSWGSILYWSQNDNAFLVGAWWWFVPPGLCLAVLGAGLAMVNLGIDEVINPRLAGAPITRRHRLARLLGFARPVRAQVAE
jgi:peptide/nickel transport system permease protein